MTHDVMITGYGIVSAYGDAARTWSGLQKRSPLVSRGFPTYGGAFPFGRSYAIKSFDPSSFIPRRGDQRAMGASMQYAVVAAGMALQHAGLLDRAELLDETALLCAARFGERDEDMDVQVAQAIAAENSDGFPPKLNELLSRLMRPGLFLAQLPNLFAGNISLVFQVRGPSMTFVGDQAAGARAIVEGYDMVRHGECRLALAGAAFNGDDYQTRLLLAGAGDLARDAAEHDTRWAGGFGAESDGVIPGVAAAFVVLESRAHAEARGAVARAELAHASCSTLPHDMGSAADAWSAAYARWLQSEAPVAGVIGQGAGLPRLDLEERRFLAAISGEREGPLLLTSPAPALGELYHAAAPLRIALAARAVEERTLFGLPSAARAPIGRALFVTDDAPAEIDSVAAICAGPEEGAFLGIVRRHEGVE